MMMMAPLGRGRVCPRARGRRAALRRPEGPAQKATRTQAWRARGTLVVMKLYSLMLPGGRGPILGGKGLFVSLLYSFHQRPVQ